MSQDADISTGRARRSRKVLWVPVLPAALGVAFLGWYLGARYVWFNLHEVIPGQVYRSSQPSPWFLDQTVQAKHLKCVIKLNSVKDNDWSREEPGEASKLGVKFINIPMGVTRLPRREELLALIDAVDSAPRPLLVHCKIGADRTGVASALIAMHDGATFDQAVSEQMGWRYLHFGHPYEAVEDIVVRYRKYCAAAKKPTGGWHEFVDFARNVYDPAAGRPAPAVLSSATNPHPQ